MKKDLKNAKDKVVGEAKEAIGKVTNNEELELKGKVQSTKADIKKKSRDIKENVAGKVNDTVDGKRKRTK